MAHLRPEAGSRTSDQPARQNAARRQLGQELHLQETQKREKCREAFCGRSSSHRLLFRENELKAAHHDNQGDQWNQLPWIMNDSSVVLQFTKQVPPRGEWLRDTKSHQSEICLGENEDWDRNPKLCQEDRPQVRQQMNKQQA